MSAADEAQEDKPAEAMTWLTEIEAAQRDMQPYYARCSRIRKLYRYENNKSLQRRQYQIFWANIETIKPTVYAKAPKAVVESRFRTKDPVANIASQLLERTIQFQVDLNDYDRTFKQTRDDFLLYARGVPRLRYEPEFDENQIEEGLDDAAVTGRDVDSETGDTQQVLKFENVHCDYVQLEDFIHPKARTWEELPWLAYRAFLTEEEWNKRFPDYQGTVPFDKTAINDDDGKAKDSATDKATIYEIWDKVNQRVLWIAKGCPEILEESDPYLKFTGFFPSPRPAYGTLTNDNLEPVPDLAYYQDQVDEINDLTARIGALTDSLKLVGFYPAGPQGEGAPEIEKAVKPGVENKLIAVKAWAAFTEGGKGGVPIVWLPVEMVEKIIRACVELRKQLIDDVYQVTGISDIMRGDTDPDETKGAQTLKAQYSSNRAKDRRNEMSRVARDVVAMVGELVSEQFQITTMMQIANMPLPSQQDVMMAQQQAMLQYRQAMLAYSQAQQAAQAQGQPAPPAPPQPQAPNLGPTQEDVLGFLRDGVARRFRIDIETDSTIAADEMAEQASRTNFVKELSQFVVAWGPIIQQTPAMAPLAGQLLLFAVRAFPVARELESVIEDTMGQIMQMAQAPKPPPQPTPDEQIKLQTAQVKGQAEQQKARTEVFATQVKAQAEAQKAALDARTAQQAHQMDMQGHAMDMAKAQADHAMQMRTLAQQTQMLEQKAIAQEAVKGMGIGQPQRVGG